MGAQRDRRESGGQGKEEGKSRGDPGHAGVATPRVTWPRVHKGTKFRQALLCVPFFSFCSPLLILSCILKLSPFLLPQSLVSALFSVLSTLLPLVCSPSHHHGLSVSCPSDHGCLWSSILKLSPALCTVCLSLCHSLSVSLCLSPSLIIRRHDSG